MPFLSEDGTRNTFVLNVNRYIGLNKHLEEAGSEQKLEDALHVMEVLSTVEGMESLEPAQTDSRLLPLKGWTIDEENSYYADVMDDLNSGHTAGFIYSGWENLVTPVGEEVIAYIRGERTIDDVIACLDENRHLLTDNTDAYYTTVSEAIGTEDCARLVGIAFAQATNADAALISVNEWKYNPDFKYMNPHGVSGCLFPLPVGDEELVSILPTGWRGNIYTVTMTGAEIKALAEYGDDEYGNGDTFPYLLITKDGAALDDAASYTIPICGKLTDEEKTAYRYQDSGVLGLDAARSYVKRFETLSADDIIWK